MSSRTLRRIPIAPDLNPKLVVCPSEPIPLRSNRHTRTLEQRQSHHTLETRPCSTVTFVTGFETSFLKWPPGRATIKIPHQEVSMNRCLALYSFLLLLLWRQLPARQNPQVKTQKLPRRHPHPRSAVNRLPSPQVPLSPCAWLAQWARKSARAATTSAPSSRDPVEVDGKVVVPAGAEALRQSRRSCTPGPL